ncbi:MAG TPA: TIGR03435 family protein [Bryobacteraceae bacterium]|nr:TIGR03435 family protein [Bryobacteraceae bacterium]
MAILVFCAAAGLAHAQGGRQSFDVASVRVATPGPGPMRIMTRGGPGSADPTHFSAENSTLLSLIMMAYEAPSYRVTGPAWLTSERFNITANVPANVTRKQFLAMLQNLLAERFQLRLHEEERLSPAFGILVDRGGPKMKESSVAAEAEVNAPISPRLDKDGIVILPAGQKGYWVNFGGGRFVIQGRQETIADLAEGLGHQLDQPVTDETGLPARYDFRLEFAPPDVQGDGSAASIFTAVRQLGLRLEPRKIPVKMIIVDRAVKTPTEN